MCRWIRRSMCLRAFRLDANLRSVSDRSTQRTSSCLRLAGWPWRLLARAPTDPYVLALEHTVPQPADLPPARDPEAIRSSYGDMAWNLEGFRMVPSIESAG